MNKRYITVLFIIFLCLIPISVHAQFELPQKDLDIQIPNSSQNEMVDELDFYSIANDFAHANFNIEPSNIIQKIITLLFGEIRSGISIFITILVLALFYSIVSIMQSDTNKNGVNEVTFFICYALTATACTKVVYDAMAITARTVDDVYMLVNKISPVFLGFVLASGKTASTALFKPLLYSCVYIMQYALKYVITPAISFSASISIVSHLNTDTGLTHFSDTVSGLVKSVLGVITTIFVSISTLYGFATPSIDALTAKTAKLAVSTAIPVVGGPMGDAIEVVTASSQVIKGAVGVGMIVVILIMTAYPFLKLAATLIIFRFAAALTEPISDKRFVGLINSIANTLRLTLAVITVSALVIIILIAVIITTTNAT